MHFNFAHVVKLSATMTGERRIASGRLERLEREERAIARLQRRRQREQEGRRSGRTEVRQARLDRRSVHGEESVVFSGSIGVELNSEGGPSCQLAVNIKYSNFEDVTSLIHSSVK